MRKLLSSIPLLIIGLLLLWHIYPTGSWCSNMATIFYGFLLFGLYCLILFITYLIYFFRYNASGGKVNLIPLYTTILLLLAYYALKSVYPSYILGKEVMTLEYSGDKRAYIVLRNNNTYDLSVSSPCAGCTVRDNYIIDHDTLKIHKTDFWMAEGKFYERYLIDTSRSRLYPLDSLHSQPDTVHALKILPKYY